MSADARNIEVEFQPKLKPTRSKSNTSRPRAKNAHLKRALSQIGMLSAAAATASALHGGFGINKGDLEKPLNQINSGVHRLIGDTGKQHPEIVDKRIPPEFDLIYPGLDGQQRSGAVANLLVKKEIIEKEYIGPNHIEELKAVARNEDKIRSYAREFGVPENLLIGLVVVESKGDPYAVSAVGAKGLTQMMDNMAEKHNLNISDDITKDNRSNPDLELRETADELFKAYEYWGDWGLAFDEWHAGRPNVFLKLQLYFKNTQGILLPNIKDTADEAESMAVKEQYIQKYREESANLFRINTNEAVVSEFSGEGYDLDLDYVPRGLAAGSVFVADSLLLK